MIPPLITAPIGDPGEPLQQVRAADRGTGQTIMVLGMRHDIIDR